MQAYSDPKRAQDPHALPDIEIWQATGEPDVDLEEGWYWWPCFPGCLPSGEPTGPFPTAEEALQDAQSGVEGGE